MYKNYIVKVTFLSSETGSVDYDFPHVFDISDPQEGNKDLIIQGTRGDGSIRIKGGKKSQRIRIRGKLYDADGYKDLTALITTMRNSVTTETGTLTLKHYDSGWVNDWVYTVCRVGEIRFPTSMRIGVQEYSVEFLVLVY